MNGFRGQCENSIQAYPIVHFFKLNIMKWIFCFILLEKLVVFFGGGSLSKTHI